MHLSMLSRWGGRPGKGGGFDCNHRPVVGFFDRFNDISSNILMTFGCYFGNPQCPGVGHLNGNSQLSSNAPPMPGLPPQRLNIDRCISCYNQLQSAAISCYKRATREAAILLVSSKRFLDALSDARQDTNPTNLLSRMSLLVLKQLKIMAFRHQHPK